MGWEDQRKCRRGAGALGTEWGLGRGVAEDVSPAWGLWGVMEGIVKWAAVRGRRRGREAARRES